MDAVAFDNMRFELGNALMGVLNVCEVRPAYILPAPSIIAPEGIMRLYVIPASRGELGLIVTFDEIKLKAALVATSNCSTTTPFGLPNLRSIFPVPRNTGFTTTTVIKAN